MTHLLVYTPQTSTRLVYILKFIFEQILKTTIEITTEIELLHQYTGPKMVYGSAPVRDVLFFKSVAFIFETRIAPVDLKTTRFGEINVPFPVTNSALPFDPFAASFFMVSRYEEYLFHKKQKMNFSAAESFQYKNGLRRPLIDEWALLLKNMLLKQFPALKFGAKKFINLPTIHLELAGTAPAGFLKRSEALFKSILNKEGRRELFDSFTGLGANMDQNLDFLNGFYKQFNVVPFYFINFEEKEDAAAAFEVFISKIKLAVNIGLLSPCPDTDNQKAISALVKIFNALPISNELVTQQLGDFSMPGCYLQLLKNGVYSDFSMGYQDTCGFRAGTCTPYYWYDLQLEKQSELKIYPYAVSDIALQNRLISQAEGTYKTIIDRIKLVEGTFSSIWSLKSLSENVKFKKWRAQYQSMIAYAGN